MVLCLLRSRLSAGRSFAAGIAKAVSGGTNTTKPLNYLGIARRFSAGAGNNNYYGKITKGCLLDAGLVANGLGLKYMNEKYVDKRLASLEVSQHTSSTLSDEAKAEMRHYVDGKFSEAQGLAKSFQAEARADVLQSRQHLDSVLSTLEHDLRAELARIRRQSDDSADKNNRVLAQRWAADEKKLAELTKEIIARRAAGEKKLAELTKEIAQIHGEVRSCDRKLHSALFEQNSRSANVGDLSSEVAELCQDFQKTDQKSKGMSAECRSKIARLSQVIQNIDRKLNSRAASEGMSAESRNEMARLSQEIRSTDRKVNSALSQMNSRAASEGNFTECSSEIARLRQKMSMLEGAVDRLVEESRKPPSDPGAGPSGKKAESQEIQARLSALE